MELDGDVGNEVSPETEMKAGKCDRCGRDSWLLRWTPMKNSADEYWCEECRAPVHPTGK
jgi:predicted RNA-binding Zn-ribbon protein involved in translation (DUF1610 family)